jgi:outer membrane receptor protein involved in Fe transport
MRHTPIRGAGRRRLPIASLLCLFTVGAATSGAQETAPSSDESVVELSPFEVSTQDDRGYRATNTISGSRLDTPIKDIPMPIEVITDEFIRDVGASDLRASLRYSAGIILQSQNDQGANAFYGAGGVHNPEGATANKTQSSFKIRGYVTDVVLRDGYRRQSATDSINIGRIEVIRGPAALLYGIGNFGGIVNYLPKEPSNQQSATVYATLGSHDFKRTAFDVTGPFGADSGVAYRLSGAWQDTGNHTELYNENHWFISPSFSYRPTSKTRIVFDFELGKQFEDALGFQTVRARSDIDGVGQADRLQSSGFVQFAGKDNRTFRWSGPDTYRDSEQSNMRIQLTQELGRNLHLLAGYNRSRVTFDARDVNGSMRQNIGPIELRDTITVIPIDVANGSSEFSQAESPNTIFEYLWTDSTEDARRQQARVELNYSLNLFEDGNKWLRMENSFLAGRSYENADTITTLNRTANNTFNYKRPTDTSYIRFGTQGDGSADMPMVDINHIDSSARNIGDYLVYQGKLLDGRLTIVAGARRDENDNSVATQVFHPTASSSSVRRPTQSDTTTQYGATLEILPQLSVYALSAGGIQPNFSGLRGPAGNPLGPVEADSTEVGIKFDLMEGKISGTVSAFKIKRTGVPFGQWWMPTLKGTFDTSRPIIYNVGNFSPSSAAGGSNGGNGAADAAIAEWNAGVTAGSIYQRDVGGVVGWYVNASDTAGAAYLDRVFELTKTTMPGWPGWLYTADAHTNNGWEDRGDGNGFQSFVQQEDESKGWDAQVLFTPTDNLQILLTYAHTKRVITNPGKFIQYPHPENRWAIWYFPDSNWGLTGYSLEEVYTDPSDTSTWTGIGWGAGQSRDDTPKHAVSAWANYQFRTGALEGFSFGIGGQWESEREYFSGITVAGQKQTDGNGNIIRLTHDPRLSLDVMARYQFKLRDRDAHVQLNVTNVLDDKDLYGLIYAPGMNARLEFAYKF